MNPASFLDDLASKGVTITADGEKLRIRPASKLDDDTLELIKTHKPAIIRHLGERGTLPRLPWQLERLVSAAGSGLLRITLQGVPDVDRYTLAWAAAYLTSDEDEALRRLWTVHAAWTGREVN